MHVSEPIVSTHASEFDRRKWTAISAFVQGAVALVSFSQDEVS